MALDDLEWAWTNSTELEEMPAPRTNVKAWTDLISQYPTEWKGILTKIYEAAKKGDIHDPDPIKERSCGDAFQCEVCGRLCNNAQALSLHMLGAHKIRAAARGFVDASNACWICGIKCPSRGRCMMHCRQGIIRNGSGSCFGQLLLRGTQPLDEEHILRLEDDEKKLRGAMRRQGRHQSDVDSWSAVQKSPMKWPELHGPLPRWAYYKKDNAVEPTMLVDDDGAELPGDETMQAGGGAVQSDVSAASLPRAGSPRGSKAEVIIEHLEVGRRPGGGVLRVFPHCVEGPRA
eukprot:TRINITY_DN35983_c0_g2_i1.p1 TRINITY_DN35983_c0_g2~~TRINITY_DN35983_c0_g2_i1.p1  ORF type:complete len:331 (-),score=43.05 TRINITY_DN35983_c0_g2_i1:321-1187(-)